MTRIVDGAPAVQVEGGRLRGRADRGVAAFLGIPYAVPPFGARRMRPPEPPGQWEGERPAAGYGATCPKGDYAPQNAALFPEVVIPGEECLNLNVWTPDPGGSGLPVLVWIHGGMFTNGSGSVAGYRGTSSPATGSCASRSTTGSPPRASSSSMTAPPTWGCWIRSPPWSGSRAISPPSAASRGR